MENLSPSPDSTHRNDASSQDNSGNILAIIKPSTGELGGLKVTHATGQQPKVFSLLETNILEAPHLGEEGSVPLHPFVQVDSSTSMSSLKTESSLRADSSPHLSVEGELNLRAIEEQRSLLHEKIRMTKDVIYPSSQRGYDDLKNCQQYYIKNLERILSTIEDLPLLGANNGEDGLVRIESAIDLLTKIADKIKKYSEETIAARVAGNEYSSNGAGGELMESFEHYLDYVQDLKTGNSSRVKVDVCLAKKCFSKFQSLEAEKNNSQKAKELFYKAYLCYSEALDRQMFGDETWEEAGNTFFSAGTMLNNHEQSLSELYEAAGTCFQKANQRCLSRIPAEINRHSQVASYWTLSGNNILNAIKALQLFKNRSLFEFYKMSSECFQCVAEKLSHTDHDPEILNEINAFNRAGNYFATAAEAIERKRPKEADIYRLLALCYRSKADAFSQKNAKASGYFEKAESIINGTIFSSLKEPTPSKKLYQSASQSIGTSYYMAGKAMLRGAEKEAQLHEKAAQCYEALLKKTDKSPLLFLNEGARYYTEAASALETRNEVEATRYELAAYYKSKAAQAQHPDSVAQWDQAAMSYLAMIVEEKKDLRRDAVIQLFNSTAQYSKIVAKIIEENSPQDKETLISLTAASRNLFLAASAMDEDDKELSHAYENCAVSHHYLVMTRSPNLLECFPLQFQMGFKKETKITPSLIDYWNHRAVENLEKIKELLALRESGSSEQH